MILVEWICFKKEMKKMNKEYNFLESNALKIVKGKKSIGGVLYA